MNKLKCLESLLANGECARWIPGLDDVYAITDRGRAFSFKGWHGRPVRELRPSPNGDGYMTIAIYQDGRRRTAGVHHCVALAFLGPPADGQQVRHRDGNPANNDLSNLLYGTVKENADDRKTHGTQTHGEQINTAKIKSESVPKIFDLSAAGIPDRVIAEHISISRAQVGNVLRGASWAHVGLDPVSDRRTGSANRAAKLSEGDVSEIRRLFAAGGETLASLGRRYGVSYVTIRNVVRGRYWKHVH